MTSDIRDTHTLSKDGKTLVPKKKRFDVCTELKRKRSPKQKFKGVPADKRDFRG